MAGAGDAWRSWRRRLKASLPWVRRREYRVLERNYAELIEAVDGGASPAADAQVTVDRPIAGDLAGEVAFFVTWADAAAPKPHVVRHVEALLAAGLHVVLIANTGLPPGSIQVPSAWRARLDGIWTRQNLGFDFAAWAHAMQRSDLSRVTRLWLVNDSIVGPLDDAAHTRMLERVRTSTADLVGLTEGLAPHRHLQSYYLVLNRRALGSAALQGLFGRVRNWPAKGQVIDLYERRLTRIAEADGLRCEALFPNLSGDPLASDDTSLRWAELVEAGFPFLKSRVIAQRPDDPRIRAWLAAAQLG